MIFRRHPVRRAIMGPVNERRCDELKLVIHMADTNGTKTNKSFDKVPDTASDTVARLFVNKYIALTNSVVTTAEKVVTTDLPLGD